MSLNYWEGKHSEDQLNENKFLNFLFLGKDIYSSPPLSVGNMLQDAQWMPETG